MSRHTLSIGGLTVLVFGLTVLFSVYLYFRPAPTRYVSANDRVFSTLPLYPGATQVRERTSPIYDGDNALARVVGYSTTRTFRLAQRESSPTVALWFVRELRGRCAVVDVVGGPAASLRCGRASVSVDAQGPLLTRRYDITVDSR